MTQATIDQKVTPVARVRWRRNADCEVIETPVVSRPVGVNAYEYMTEDDGFVLKAAGRANSATCTPA